MVRNMLIPILLTQVLVLAQILAGQYEFWDYYGAYVYDYSGNGRHAEITNAGTIPVLTDRGLYISDGYTLNFPQNSYKDFPSTCTDMVVSVLFYPKTDKRFCLINVIVGDEYAQVCFTSETSMIKISIEGSWNFAQTTAHTFNVWKLYTVRFSQVSGNTYLYVYINGDSDNTALAFMINSFSFAAVGSRWELGSSSIEGFLYQIWWHCQVTISIKTLSASMINTASSPCSTLYAMTPYQKCLSNQLDKFKNSENELCSDCISLNQSCDKDQLCIDSCQFNCIAPSDCRSVSYPICSSTPPTYCSAVPGTDICYKCNIGWIMSTTTPGICEITVPGCKTFNIYAQCIECQPGYYRTTTTPATCITCPDGCEICSLSSGIVVCSKCPSGQIIHTGPLCVSVCPPSFYANTLVTPSRCATCHAGCKSCTLNLSIVFAVCSECIEGYYLMHYLNSLTYYDRSKIQCSLNCDLNYYGDTSATPSICKLCRSNCELCTNSTDCSQCIVGYMLSEDTLSCSVCVAGCKTCLTTTICEVCRDGTYLDPITKKCNDCSWGCNKCSDQNSCQSCRFGIIFITPTSAECRLKCSNVAYISGIYKVCAEYSADNLEVTYCSVDSNSIATCNNCLATQAGTSECPATICGQNCLRCNTIDGVVVCIICSVGYYLQPDMLTCKTNCPDFFYPRSSTTTCIPCIANCKRCISSSSLCEECIENYSLANNYSSCNLACPLGFYTDKAGAWRCMPCITNCNRCSNSSDCLLCLNSMYVVTSSTGVISCETACPPRNTFDTNRVCYYCHDNCDVCTITSGVITCTTCSVGYILINKVCIELKCDPNCINCVISSTILRCDLCKSGYFIDPYGYLCLSVCSAKYYADTGTKRCADCMANCETCQEATISNPTCTICSPNHIFKDYLGVNICEYTTCPVSCTDCTITSPGIICNSCNINYFMYPSLPKCEMICPQEYYGDTTDNTCKACSDNCETCNMSGCIQCKSGTYLQPDLTCDISCPDRYYSEDSTWRCKICPNYCSSCILENNQVNCTECDQTHYLRLDKTCDTVCEEQYYPDSTNNKCEKCPIDSCANCERSIDSSFICNRCIINFYLLDSSSCSVDCPTSYYKDETQDIKECNSCQEGCKICTNDYDCIECIENYYTQPEEYEKRCDSTCPYGYYISNYVETKTCSPCKDHCKICINYESCLECDDGYLIQPYGPVVCDSTCKEEFFPTRTIPFTCTPCFSNCLECEENKCIKCKPLYTAKPPPVDNSDACLPCTKNCIACEYKNNKSVCKECQGGFYFQPNGYDKELECDKTCPDGYYIDMISLSCRECPVGKYGVGTECLDCEIRCTACSRVDKCSECIENAIVVNDICDCLSNFEFDGVECIERYFDLDLEFKNDTLVLKFEYPLSENLDLNDVDIFIDEVQYTSDQFILEVFDLQTLLVKSEVFLLNSDKKLIVSFKSHLSILDIYNHSLSNSEYRIIIPYYQAIITQPEDEADIEIEQTGTTPEQVMIEQTKYMESTTSSTVSGAAGVSAGSSISNTNPGSLWDILNTIQVLSYINIINIPIPPRAKGVCKAFASFNFMPNLFELFIDKREFKMETRFSDNAIETAQFLINTGKILSMLSIIITAYIILKLIKQATLTCNKDSKLQKVLNFALKHLEWNIFTRLCIQGYMEISFASMLNLSYLPVSDLSLAMDFMVSCIFFLLVLTSPFYLLYFTLKNSTRIDDSEFKSKWSSLYGSYKSSDYTRIFNVIFLVRRLLYGATIIFLGASPRFQIISCSLLSYSILCYTFIHQPYISKKENILNCISEGCTLLSLCSLFVYSFNLGDVLSEYLDYAIVVIINASFMIPSLVNLIEALIKITNMIIQRLRRRRNVHEVKENTTQISTLNVRR